MLHYDKIVENNLDNALRLNYHGLQNNLFPYHYFTFLSPQIRYSTFLDHAQFIFSVETVQI